MNEDGSHHEKLRIVITVLLIFAAGMMLGRIAGRVLFQMI